MPLILSTKVLPPKLKRHLFAANISFVEYNAVKIVPTDISFTKTEFPNTIVTSQNAVKLAIGQHKLNFHNVFCVGEKTANLLLTFGISPKYIANNAIDLARFIVEKHPNQSFDFFCSAQRRHELPELLDKHNVKLKEHNVYQSVSNNKYFKNNFDAVLCFSPLGVKTYYENHSYKPTAICIGCTTSKFAKEFTSQVLTSSKTSVESVVIKTIKTLA